ncbi:hypothetical protein VUR80DRAFT_4181 [Thermomyces stellatus]
MWMLDLSASFSTTTSSVLALFRTSPMTTFSGLLDSFLMKANCQKVSDRDSSARGTSRMCRKLAIPAEAPGSTSNEECISHLGCSASGCDGECDDHVKDWNIREGIAPYIDCSSSLLLPMLDRLHLKLSDSVGQYIGPILHGTVVRLGVGQGDILRRRLHPQGRIRRSHNHGVSYLI